MAARKPLMSGLLRQILLYNLVSMLLLMLGLYYFGRSQDDLVQAREAALLTEAHLTARALGAVAADAPAAGEGDARARAARVLSRLLRPESAHVRLYGEDGELILESGDLGLQREGQELSGETTRAILAAVAGGPGMSVEGMNLHNERIVLAAVPVRLPGAGDGVLLLSTPGDDIAAIVRNERNAFLRAFLLVLAVTTLLCIALAFSIAWPIRTLARTADRIRAGIANRRIEVPDFSRREDEIGTLSIAMRQMTQALYDQLDAVAGFGADVAHELKNPLTSLRSALEALVATDKRESQERLKDVVMDDVQRINRLITDISAASRLGADMASAEPQRLNVRAFLYAVVGIYRRMEREAEEGSGMRHVHLEESDDAPRELFVSGIDERLGQVVRNLIDNAISFSPPGAQVRVLVAATAEQVEIRIEDDGPGIPEDALERIFSRFYTDRPDPEAFGQHSGLGLAISRQIVETHKGSLRAENREPPAHGARFVMTLPRVA